LIGSIRFEPDLNNRNAFQSVVTCRNEHIQLRYNEGRIYSRFTQRFHDEYPSRIWNASIAEMNPQVVSFTNLKGNPVKILPSLGSDDLLTNFIEVPSILTIKGNVLVSFVLV
jgi:hypothetical protein